MTRASPRLDRRVPPPPGACGPPGFGALVLWGALSVLAIFLHYKGYLGKGTHMDSLIKCAFKPIFVLNGLIAAEFVGEEASVLLSF